MKDQFIKTKLDNLLLEIVRRQEFDGSTIVLQNNWENEDWSKMGINSPREGLFYLNALSELNFINLDKTTWSMIGDIQFDSPGKISLTYQGLKYALEIQEHGENSNKCFVAISFDERHKYLFTEAFYPVCTDNQFSAFLVNQVHGGSTQTIKDFIISSIKQSKFCIADSSG